MKAVKREVSFAPTRVFREKYGEAMAKAEEAKFTRPTWAPAPEPTCEKVHPNPLVSKEEKREVENTDDRDAVFILLGTLVLGMGLGILVGVYLART